MLKKAVARMIIMVIGGGVGVGNVDGGVDGGDGDCTEVSDFLDAIVVSR